MHSILFVCTGNICRSPTAEGILRHLTENQGLASHITTDSAALYGYHSGEPPDARSIVMAKRHGVTLDTLRARQVCEEDFTRFSLILAMDASHFTGLKRIEPPHATASVEPFLPYCGITHKVDVPDPYYGVEKDFKETYDLIEQGVRCLLEKLHTP